MLGTMYFPFAQSMHRATLGEPVCVLYLPLKHEMHVLDACASTSFHFPVMQAVQDGLPVLLIQNPLGQFLQTETFVLAV